MAEAEVATAAVVGGNKKLIIVIIVLVALLAGVGGAFLAMQMGGKAAVVPGAEGADEAVAEKEPAVESIYIDLQPGPQLLKGNDLEGFLRFRYDEWGDIGRIERQQLALKALFRKLTRPENLVRLPMLLAAGGNDVKTDLGPLELGGLITAMGSTELKTERLGGRPFMRDGISYWEADWPRPAGDGDGSFDNNYVY